jgi:hypothetical protein
MPAAMLWAVTRSWRGEGSFWALAGMAGVV